MARRTIKEGEPIDPIQVGDIITLELKNGSIISELLAAPAHDSENACCECYMFRNRERHACNCFDKWVLKNPERHGSDYTDVALCCTKPVFATESSHNPEFCIFIKIDTIMENL